MGAWFAGIHHSALAQKLQSTGYTVVEPISPSERYARVFFVYRGMRYVARRQPYFSNKFQPVIYGFVAPPPELDHRPQVARIPHVCVKKSNVFDRLGNALRMRRVVKTGDLAFDAAVCIDTRELEAAVRELFALPEVRAQALAILDSNGGSTSLGFGEYDSVVTVTNQFGDISLTPALLDALARLANYLPRPSTPIRSQHQTMGGEILAGLVLISSVFPFPIFLFIHVLFALGPYETSFYWIAFGLSFFTYAFMMFALFLFFRRYPRGHIFLSFLVFFMVFAAPFTTLSALETANYVLPSEIRTVDVVLEDVSCSSPTHRSSGGCTGYFRAKSGERYDVRLGKDIERFPLTRTCGRAKLVEDTGGLGFPIAQSLHRYNDPGVPCPSLRN